MSGFTRLVSVFSVVWLIIAAGLICFERSEFVEEYERNLALPPPPKGYVLENNAHSLYFRWQPLDLMAEGRDAYVRVFKPDVFNILFLVMTPIIGMWFIYLSALWVANGFKKK